MSTRTEQPSRLRCIGVPVTHHLITALSREAISADWELKTF